MTTVDIVMPFYGDFDYLKAAVLSVMGQSDHAWRLIVLDDGYPDQEVSKWFGKINHPGVEYHRNASNLGANENYRRALSLSTADHVVVMGADDLMLPNYIAAVRRVFDSEPDVAVVQPGVSIIDDGGRIVTPLADRIKQWAKPRKGRTSRLFGETLAVSLLRANWTYFPSLCWRRAAIKSVGFRVGFDVVQDLALLLDVVADGGSMIVDSEPAFLYRRHAGSDSAIRASSGSRFLEECQFFEAMRQENAARGWTRAAGAAHLHLTSRLHAAALIPPCMVARQWNSVLQLSKHALLT